MTIAEQDAYMQMEVIVRRLREYVEEGSDVIHFSSLIDVYDNEGNEVEITFAKAVVDAQDALDNAQF